MEQSVFGVTMLGCTAASWGTEASPLVTSFHVHLSLFRAMALCLCPWLLCVLADMLRVVHPFLRWVLSSRLFHRPMSLTALL